MISGISLPPDLPGATIRRPPRFLDVTIPNHRAQRHQRPRKSQRKLNSRSYQLKLGSQDERHGC
jgi:hypothetical protein